MTDVTSQSLRLWRVLDARATHHSRGGPPLANPGLMAGQATPSAPGTLRRLEPAARWFGGGSAHEDWLIYDRARFRDRPLPI